MTSLKLWDMQVTCAKAFLRSLATSSQNQTPPAPEKLHFAGNNAADHVASRAFNMWPKMMESWHHLCSQLGHLRCLRDGLHTMLLNIGVECLLKRPETSAKQATSGKLHETQLVMMTKWEFPEELPPEAAPYAIPELEDIRTWISILHDTGQPVQRWSWCQLYVDAAFRVKSSGPWYHTNAKQWKGGMTQPPEPFLGRAQWFSQFLTKLAKTCKLALGRSTQVPLEASLPSGQQLCQYRPHWSERRRLRSGFDSTFLVPAKLQTYVKLKDERLQRSYDENALQQSLG